MSSDSEDERRGHGQYAPVLAEKLATVAKASGSPTASKPQAVPWFRDGVSLYNNELYTDGDVLADEHHNGPASPSQPAAGTPNNKKSLAAKRQERLQAGGAYEANTMIKSPSTRTPPAGPDRTGSTAARALNLTQTSSLNPARGDDGTSTSGTAGLVHGLGGVYDPTPQQPEARQVYSHYGAAPPPSTMMNGRSAMPAPRPSPPIQVDLSDIEAFLHAPGPRNGPILCSITRIKPLSKGPGKVYPTYMLSLEDGNQFLLSARKRKGQTTSNYVISLDPENVERDSDAFFGKVRANFVGTEFTLYDNGEKLGDKKRDPNRATRQELACVTYQYNVLGTRGPRKMTAAIPMLDSSGNSLYNPTSEDDTLLDRLKNNRGLEELAVMRNKPPRWNEELEAYCLNFNGRVTEASVKNFQLVTDNDHNHIILQFGKTGQETFTMDYQWPISALQAFALCISSFDGKLGCE